MVILYVLLYLVLWILSQSCNIECRIVNFTFLLSVTLFKIPIIVLLPHNTFLQVAGFIPSGFVIFFITGGSESFYLLRSPAIVLHLCSSSLRKCNACTVRFRIPCCYWGRLLIVQLCWKGWMLERDSGPWPMHQYHSVVLAWVNCLHHNQSIKSCSL